MVTTEKNIYQHTLHLVTGEEVLGKEKNYSKSLWRKNKAFGNLGKNDELPLAKTVNPEQSFPKCGI